MSGGPFRTVTLGWRLRWRGHDHHVTTAAGLDDVQAAGAVLTRAWLNSEPFVSWTPADLTWWFAQAWPTELSERLRLWAAGDRVVGWSWEDGPELAAQAWSGDRGLDDAVERGILARAIDQATVGMDHCLGDGSRAPWPGQAHRGVLG